MITDDSRMQEPVPIAIEHPDLVSYRSEFPILQRKTYMNSCSLGALSQRSMQGMMQFMELWNEWGAHAWYEIWMGQIANVRRKFATIIGAQLHEVAIAPSVSAALSSVATALDYSKRNNVVMADIAHKHGAFVLIDDYQGTGQIPIDVVSMDIDLPNLHLVRSLAYYLLVAAYLILPPCDFAVAFTTVVLSISLSPALWKE